MPDFKSKGGRSDRHAHAAENCRSRGTAAANEVARKDIVLGIDELSRLAVAPSVCPNAGADIRLNRFIVAEWNQPNRRRERNDPKFERLLDVGAVLVHRIGIKRGHRSLIEPEAQAAFNIASETEQ